MPFFNNYNIKFVVIRWMDYMVENNIGYEVNSTNLKSAEIITNLNRSIIIDRYKHIRYGLVVDTLNTKHICTSKDNMNSDVLFASHKRLGQPVQFINKVRSHFKQRPFQYNKHLTLYCKYGGKASWLKAAMLIDKTPPLTSNNTETILDVNVSYSHIVTTIPKNNIGYTTIRNASNIMNLPIISVYDIIGTHGVHI